MNSSLEQFCQQTKDILQTDGPFPERLGEIARSLSELLADPAFVAETFSDETPVGKRVLYHDPSTDFYVLAHVQQAGKAAPPTHTGPHGRSMEMRVDTRT